MSQHVQNLKRQIEQVKAGFAEASGELDRLPADTAETARRDFADALSELRSWISDAEEAAEADDPDEITRRTRHGEELLQDLSMVRKAAK